MLEKLDSIDWGSIDHSHGTAEQFPQWIRDLTSPDEKVWYKAWDSLREYTNHQNTFYPVTPYVIPFLTELLQLGELQSCAKIIELFEHYASSESWFANKKALAAYDKVSQEWIDEGRISSVEYRKSYKALTQEVHNYLFDALPILLNFLTNGSIEKRRAAIRTIVAFQSHHEMTIPALANALDKETFSAFLDVIQEWNLWRTRRIYYGYGDSWAIEYTKPERRLFIAPLMQLMDSVKDANEKYEIAEVLTRLAEEETPLSVADILCELGGPWASEAISTLRIDEALKRLRYLLSLAENPSAAHEVAYAMLEKVFIGYYRTCYSSSSPAVTDYGVCCSSEPDPELPVEIKGGKVFQSDRTYFTITKPSLNGMSLTPDQRSVLQLIVENDLVWEYPSNLLELYGLPAERSKVRALLEG